MHDQRGRGTADGDIGNTDSKTLARTSGSAEVQVSREGIAESAHTKLHRVSTPYHFFILGFIFAFLFG